MAWRLALGDILHTWDALAIGDKPTGRVLLRSKNAWHGNCTVLDKTPKQLPKRCHRHRFDSMHLSLIRRTSMPPTKRHLPRPYLLRWCGSALTLAIGLAGVQPAVASNSPPLAASAIATMDLSGLKSSHSYTPALGESLERIVAKTMPESPLSAQVLSQAFVLLNPQAFGSSKPQRTHSTATLKVPNHNQLMQLVLARNPAELAPARATEAPPTKVAATPRPTEKRENWVRYAGGPVKSPANFDGSTAERSGWVHYLGTAFTRNRSGDAASRSETRSWVQYPSLGRATTAQTEVSADSVKWVQYPSVARAPAPAAQPETRLDTSGWVRFVANRLYPQQQFAQLFD